MKIFNKIILLLVCLLTIACVCVACNKTPNQNDSSTTSSSQENNSIVGKYSLSSISGTIENKDVDESMYEYFEIILNENGLGTIRSKGTNGGEEYEASGSYTYENGQVNIVIEENGVAFTEKYEYKDNKLYYTMQAPNINFTVVLAKEN